MWNLKKGEGENLRVREIAKKLDWWTNEIEKTLRITRIWIIKIIGERKGRKNSLPIIIECKIIKRRRIQKIRGGEKIEREGRNGKAGAN